MIFPEEGAAADIFADHRLIGIIRLGPETTTAVEGLQKIVCIQVKDEISRMHSLRPRSA